MLTATERRALEFSRALSQARRDLEGILDAISDIMAAASRALPPITHDKEFYPVLETIATASGLVCDARLRVIDATSPVGRAHELSC